MIHLSHPDLVLYAGIFLAVAGTLTALLALRSAHQNGPVYCQECLWRGLTTRRYQKHYRRCHAGVRGYRLPRTEPDLRKAVDNDQALTEAFAHRAPPAAPLPRRYT